MNGLIVKLKQFIVNRQNVTIKEKMNSFNHFNRRPTPYPRPVPTISISSGTTTIPFPIAMARPSVQLGFDLCMVLKAICLAALKNRGAHWWPITVRATNGRCTSSSFIVSAPHPMCFTPSGVGQEFHGLAHSAIFDILRSLSREYGFVLEWTYV